MKRTTPTTKPRVLIDTFHLYNALTGIRTYTTQLCQGIEANEQNLFAEYVIFPNWRKLNNSSFLKGRLSPIKKFINHFTMLVWKQLILPFIIIWKKIDVVFVPDFVAPYFKSGAICMSVIHDTFFWDFPQNYPLLWRKYYIGMINLGLQKNSVIIATSEYTKSNLRGKVNQKLPIEVIYQSPKLHKVESESAVLTKYGIQRTPYFLHVGVFDRRKNIRILVEAFAEFISQSKTSYKLVLVGEHGLGSRHNDFNQIQELVEKLSIRSSVIFTGFVSNEELSTLYSHTFAYVFPSLDEGFGIPVLEAMHCSVPVIVSDRGSLIEIAGDAALVFKADDHKDLRDKMLMVEDKKLRKTLIRKGEQRVALFSPTFFAQQLDELVKKYAL